MLTALDEGACHRAGGSIQHPHRPTRRCPLRCRASTPRSLTTPPLRFRRGFADRRSFRGHRRRLEISPENAVRRGLGRVV